MTLAEAVHVLLDPLETLVKLRWRCVSPDSAATTERRMKT